MVTTRPPKTIVKPTALGPVANTDTKLLIYGLFQKGRVLAQDGKLAPIDSLWCTALWFLGLVEPRSHHGTIKEIWVSTLNISTPI